jgi:anti-sigma regulatory factor (Ser/Thr protein kinase)/predicted ArsR family transcriptional regulator
VTRCLAPVYRLGPAGQEMIALDWYLERQDPAVVPHLRREIMTYLTRHASPGTDTGDAELVVSELLANACEHAHGPAWVSLRWEEIHPVISVADLGPGFPPELLGRHRPVDDRPDPWAVRGRGLFLVSHLARDLAVAARAAGGSVVRATLDVSREPESAIPPPHRSATPLPALEEAGPRGAFDRETFLRALVAQLLQTVELQHGPQAGQAAINQVGADVGRQIEAEFRAARALAGRLTHQELAECLVRLTRAMGGEVQVAECSPVRLVLTASRCPFGEAVRRAPALCRATAAVLGGVATRNVPHGEASVSLEERIAVGDPTCRIVVWLDPDEATTSPETLRFLASREPTPSPARR